MSFWWQQQVARGLVVILLAAPLVVMSPQIAASSAITATQANGLLEASGLGGAVMMAVARIVPSINAAKPTMSDDERLTLAQTYNSGAFAEEILQQARTELQSQLSVAHETTIAAWFTNGVGKIMADAERAIVTPQQQEAMRQAMSRANGQALNFDREQLLRELSEAAQSSETQTEILQDFLAIVTPKIKDPTQLALTQRQIEVSQRDGLEQALRAMDFVYKNLPDDKIQQAIQFYRSEAGVAWTKAARAVSRATWRRVNQIILDSSPLPAMPTAAPVKP